MIIYKTTNKINGKRSTVECPYCNKIGGYAQMIQ